MHPEHRLGRRAAGVAALTAAVGVATLSVYGFLGLAREVDPGAFHALANTPDIGLSAIVAAWIGVVAQTFWRRYPSSRARMLNVLGCAGCGLIGFAFRPNLTALDSEHLVAFALGVAIAAWWPVSVWRSRWAVPSAYLPRPLARPRWSSAHVQPFRPRQSTRSQPPGRR